MQTQTDWQIAEPQITWGRQQKGILNQHVRLQPRTYAQNCICRIVRSNAAIIQIQMASAYMESVAPSGLYLLLFLLLVVKCHHGFLSFSIYWLQDTKALVIYTRQNIHIKPSNLIQPPLQGTNNPTAVCRAKVWCARTDPKWLEGCVGSYTKCLHCRCDLAELNANA